MGKLLSFGKIIWDTYEREACLGGATLNFSAHAAACGQEVYLLSAIGRDPLGEQALCRLRGRGGIPRFVHYTDGETGRCLVTLAGGGTTPGVAE